mmetsp:Transcript_1170/g.2748  ORF Transcript_1170/g.2748 Transcript_1170/m.2748 type:complete len:93 (-) Transcript_1170:426-704(-)
MSSDSESSKPGTVQETAWTLQRMTWLRKTEEFDQQTEGKLSHDKAERQTAFRASRMSFDDIEDCIASSKPFPHPVPLPVMVAVVSEIWDEES